VFSGDTSLCDSLARAANGADLLVSDALNPAMFDALRERIRAVRPTVAALLDDVPSYHISTEEVARMARDAGVGKLVLSHLIPNLPANEEMEAQFAAGLHEIYTGPIVVARDMQRMPVPGRND